MRAARVGVIFSGLPLWIYSWYFLRGVQTEYAAGEIGPMPFWLVFLLGLVTTGLIGAVVATSLRSRIWPALASAVAIALPACMILAQQAVMRGALLTFGSRQPVLLSVAAKAAFRSLPAWEMVVVGVGSAVLLISSAAEVLAARALTPRIPKHLPPDVMVKSDGSNSLEEGG